MTRKTKPPIALYSALADVTRCRIIEILAQGPIPVHRLADSFAISRPAISRHLRVLKEAGLVAEIKKGRENLYAFRARKLDKAVTWLEAFSAPEGEVEVETSVVEAAAIPVVTPAVVEQPAQPFVVKPRAEGKGEAEMPKPRFGKKPVQPVQPDEAHVLPQMGFDF